MKRSSFYKKFAIIATLALIGILNSETLMGVYFRLTPYYSSTYAQDKELILPYFDEAYYKRTYAAELETTGEAPLDHFLRRSCRMGGGEYDPNDWFSVTLYKHRLWPCSGNPLVDFLRQPKTLVPKDAPPVEVYANKDQLFRAWMAVEGFLRKKKFQVILILPEAFKDALPLRFGPMMKRGLQVRFSKDPTLSFYKSPFLREPEKYAVRDLPVQDKPESTQAVSRIRFVLDSNIQCISESGFENKTRAPGVYIVHEDAKCRDFRKTDFERRRVCEYLAHRLYKSTPWKQKGLLNPCMLNFGFFRTEPIVFSDFGSTEEEFHKNIKRLAPGFDLLFLNTDIGTPNLRIIPGFMSTFVEANEIPKEKIFGVSFLLSFGGKGISSFKTRDSFIYHFRKEIWGKEKDFTLPTQFFISRRDIKKYPNDLQHRALPDESKKWVFGTQFTIAIENSRQAHYFSEKLIDCFIALTVPIYIGCPNVTDYFDVRGMLIAKDPDDAVRITNTLTPESYAKMLPYLLENKRRAEVYMKKEETLIQEFFTRPSA